MNASAIECNTYKPITIKQNMLNASSPFADFGAS